MSRFDRPAFRQSKFRELLIYIAAKCQRDVYFGATKVNKILFYADFLAFSKLGAAITWATYFAEKHGPVAPVLPEARDELVMEGALAIDKSRRQHRVVALRQPDLSQFSAAEIALVDEVIDDLRHLNADGVSDLSHTFLGWKAAREECLATGKPVAIPYETAFVSNEPLDLFEEAEALELARRHGWPIERSADH